MTAFFLAPVLFGIDKYFDWMTYWPNYLWIGSPHFLNVSQIALRDFGLLIGALALARLAAAFHNRPIRPITND